MTAAPQTPVTPGLEIGGQSVEALARVHGTPLYVYDEAGLRSTCRAYRQAFSTQRMRTSVAYAMKAFGAVAMLRLAHEEGLGLDVVSVGELALARRARVPLDDITVHGVGKKRDELETMVRSGVGHIALDSVEEVAELADVCRRLDRCQPVLVRINPGTTVPTDPRYRTSGAQSKFGIAIEDGHARRAIDAVSRSPYLRLDGLHFHLGSQLMEAGPYIDAMARTAALLRTSGGWRPSKIVVGGGMGVAYGPAPAAPAPAAWARWLVGAFAQLLEPLCEPDVVLGIEPGRSVVAEHGSTLYTVGAVKAPPGDPGRVIAVIDGGLSDNPRPLMYSASHTVQSATRPGPGAGVLAQLFGRHCETDLMFADVALPAVDRGDILVVRETGAYTHSMASNYNGFLRPAVVFVKDGVSRTVVRRETPADLLRLELTT